LKKLKVIIGVIALLLISSFAFAQVELVGAGATFPAPLYTKMFDAYYQETGVKVNYQAIGSGGGQAQLTARTVDFGASDAFMTDEQLKTVPAAIVHIPIVAGAVVLTANLPGDPALKLTGDIIADIFLGKISNWNDPRIAALNPSVKFPNLNITVVHRSDGSGTTAVFSDYLSKVSTDWKTKVGTGTSLNWPVGIGGKGNPGVAGLVKQMPGSIGYVELIYVLQNKMPFASIKNKSGNFITPSLESTTIACAVSIPNDTRLSITDTAAPQGYPIASFTWIILYKEQAYGDRKDKADAVVKLIWWMTHDGQKLAAPLAYAALPKQAVEKAEAVIKSITYNGKPIF
jgi:phosphate transport system substrate-binding protein